MTASFLFDPFLAHAREEEEEANIWAYFSEFFCEDIVIMASMKLSPKKRQRSDSKFNSCKFGEFVFDEFLLPLLKFCENALVKTFRKM